MIPHFVKLQLYKSVVRPNVEYSSQVWSPHYKQDIKQVESVQRGMTRFIVQNSDISYTDRCKQLNLLPLSYRREVMDLAFLYKYLQGDIDVCFDNDVSFVNADSGRRSSSHGPKLYHANRARTETYECSYFNRIVSLWNKLPSTIRNCDSLFSFKAALNEHYCSKVDKYDIDNPCTWTSVCRCSTCLASQSY